MPLGRVKWYSLEKGFGFIESEEGADVYLASSALPAGVATVSQEPNLNSESSKARKVHKQ